MYRGDDALVRGAINASTDVAELRDSRGRPARLDRDAEYPEAICIRLDATSEDPVFATHWVLPPVAQRPNFYPDEVPFAPNLACLAMEGEGRLEVRWGEDVSDLSADPENLAPKLEDSVPASLREAVESMNQRRDRGESVAEVSLKDLAEQLGDDSLREWVDELHKPSRPSERFETGLARLRQASIESGWQEEPFPGEVAPGVQLVFLRLSSSQRILMLMSVLGVNNLRMTQSTAVAQGPAPREG